MSISKDQVLGIVRHVLTAVGVYLVAQGLASEGLVEEGVGGTDGHEVACALDGCDAGGFLDQLQGGGSALVDGAAGAHLGVVAGAGDWFHHRCDLGGHPDGGGDRGEERRPLACRAGCVLPHAAPAVRRLRVCTRVASAGTGRGDLRLSCTLDGWKKLLLLSRKCCS